MTIDVTQVDLNNLNLDVGPFDFTSKHVGGRAKKSAGLDFLSWMKRRRSFLKPGVRFDLVNHRYLEGIYQDDYPEIVICKAGQTGISEYALSWILWSADERSATGLYVFPTDTHVSDFSAARLGAAIEEETSPYLAGLVRGAGAGQSYRGADRVGLKRIRDRFIYFRGAKVQPDGRAPQLRSIDADTLVLDEYDEMDVRAPAIAVERLGHSAFAEQRKISTPTFSNVGIHAEYLASDQRRWFVRCTRCHQPQDLRLDDLIIESDGLGRPVAWHQDSDGQPFLACRKCGGVLDRAGPGEWVAEYPSVDVHGYHLSRLFAAFKPLSDIIVGLMNVDDSKRQQIYNQALGLPYSSSSAVKLSSDVLDQCKRDYAQAPAGETKNKIICGVDVGKALHVVIREILPDGSRQARFIGEVIEFSDVTHLMKQHGVQTVVVDALPETREARNFQAAWPEGTVWLAYYPNQAVGSKKERFVIEDMDEGTVNIDRTRSLDSTLSLFALGAREDESEPRNTLPANIKNVPDYYAHMTAIERRFRKAADGNQVPAYVETGPDHYAHAENYANVAAEVEPKWKSIPFMSA